MIEFIGVSKEYDNGTVALQSVNLKIEKGEFVFIVGSSGAGKSTFLKLIICEEEPSAGEIIVNDFRLSELKLREVPYLRRTMGIIFQDFRLVPKMNVYENIAFAMRIVGATSKEIRKKVPYVLNLVGLENKARCMPNELSGGEQQRVGLARALINSPGMIIADEPTGNIDPERSLEIMELLNEINRHGTTVVMVTHEHEMIKKFEHRVVKIEDGIVVSDTGLHEDFIQMRDKNVVEDMSYDILNMSVDITSFDLDVNSIASEFADEDIDISGFDTGNMVQDNEVYSDTQQNETSVNNEDNA